MGERASSSRSGGLTTVRRYAARVIRVVFTTIAALLAIGALMVALRHNINEDNVLVQAVLKFDDFVAGPFGRTNGIFSFSGKNAMAKDAIVNWGIAALVYLLLGRLLERLVRP